MPNNKYKLSQLQTESLGSTTIYLFFPIPAIMQPAGAGSSANLRSPSVDNRLSGAHQNRNGFLPDAKCSRRKLAGRRFAPHDTELEWVRAAMRSLHLR